MEDCIFCKIVEKKLPARIIYENEQIVAFHDINPQAPTHILIIPRSHIPTVNDITSDDTAVIGELLQVAKRLAKEVGIDRRGYRLVMNCNRAGGQDVYHLHLHLLGGRPMRWPPG